MKKFSVALPFHCSVFFEIEAETEAEAVQKAKDDQAGFVTLCHQCSSNVEMGEMNEEAAESPLCISAYEILDK